MNQTTIIQESLDDINNRLRQLELRVKHITSYALMISNRENMFTKLKHLENCSLGLLKDVDEQTFSPELSKAVLYNQSIRRSIYSSLQEFDELLDERRFNLTKVLSDRDLDALLPKFDSVSLPLFPNFLAAFENLCDLAPIPTISRSPYLLACIKGIAKETTLLLNIDQEKEYEKLIGMLSAYFGNHSRQMTLLLDLQKQIQPIRSLSENNTSSISGFKFFDKQLQILHAAKALENSSSDTPKSNDSLSHGFIDKLVGRLPRDCSLFLVNNCKGTETPGQRLNDLITLCERRKMMFWQEIIRSGVNEELSCESQSHCIMDKDKMVGEQGPQSPVHKFSRQKRVRRNRRKRKRKKICNQLDMSSGKEELKGSSEGFVSSPADHPTGDEINLLLDCPSNKAGHNPRGVHTLGKITPCDKSIAEPFTKGMNERDSDAYDCVRILLLLSMFLTAKGNKPYPACKTNQNIIIPQRWRKVLSALILWLPAIFLFYPF